MRTISQTVADWIEANAAGTAIDGLPIYTDRSEGTRTRPCVTVVSDKPEPFTQGDVVMRGVHTHTVAVVIETVPGEAADSATDQETATAMAEAMNDILGDSDFETFAATRNQYQIFDILAGHPAAEVADGVRLEITELTIVACPL